MSDNPIIQPEHWLRGPVANVPSMLQPVAHALLQARDEINQAMEGFPENGLWVKPAEMASVAFHLKHIPGVLDRLFTYADGQELSATQRAYLAEESKDDSSQDVARLLSMLNAGIDEAVKKVGLIDAETLTDERLVGKKQLPSTVIGLLFHAAEHTMRHTGQLLVTAAIVRSDPGK
ncbi:DinB family protein [Flavihumibacter solisilvae]|uniref:Metal-dependent hydrolase n=1 Tax=Flavihumibacter solisilvae TaxID=1349421 RepID=A0A0C1LHX9_9BACT|nr:DinB family protein [Flavihumibacter solisilvae]KIC94983.1 metal-dependent hydrolase [Flavihumibacter solisilvae]